MATKQKAVVTSHDAQTIVAIHKYLQTEPSLSLGGAVFTPTDLAALLQSRIDTVARVAADEATWHASVEAERELTTKLTPILRALREVVINKFGAGASPVLADFGFTVRKRAPLTPEQKAAAAAKAKATRAARHTMGAKQKKGVKGTVATAPAASTASTASSPAAPPAPKAS
jgi:hypothetical protein